MRGARRHGKIERVLSDESRAPAGMGPEGSGPGWLSSIRIVQGGMDVAISGWRLARAVAAHPGCLGVVSGTCIDMVMARRLQDGDPGAHLRLAMGEFPDQEPQIVTSGDDLVRLPSLLSSIRPDCGADDVIRYLDGAAPGL
jgi:hypothetical protein